MISILLAISSIALVVVFQAIKHFLHPKFKNIKVMAIQRYEEFNSKGNPVLKLDATFSSWAAETQLLILQEAPKSTALSVRVLREFYNKCYLPEEVVAEIKGSSVKQAA